MSGHCARCACGQIPEQWCAGCPNRPQPIGKTWDEESIEKWLEMEPGDDATMLLREIMRENWKQSIKREPRRLFRGTVFLRRYGARDKRLGRVGKAQFRQYHAEGLSWPFGVHARPDGVPEAFVPGFCGMPGCSDCEKHKTALGVAIPLKREPEA